MLGPMNESQTRQLAQFKAVARFLESHRGVLQAQPALLAAKTQFDGHLLKLDGLSHPADEAASNPDHLPVSNPAPSGGSGSAPPTRAVEGAQPIDLSAGLAEEFRVTEALLAERIDPLVDRLRSSEPAFAKGYHASRDGRAIGGGQPAGGGLGPTVRRPGPGPVPADGQRPQG